MRSETVGNPTILHLEDSSLDADLIAQRLSRSGFACDLHRVADREGFVARLRDDRCYDLILSDYQIPGFDGLEALEMAKIQRPDVPFVFVSGAIGEDVAVEMLKCGATDYVLKGRLDRLGPAIERALAESREKLRRKQVERALRESEERLRMALTAVRMVAWELVPSPRKVMFSGDLHAVFGLLPASELTNQEQRYALVHPDDLEKHVAMVEATVRHGGSYLDRFRIVRQDNGDVQWMEERAYAISDASGKTARLLGVIVDVTERKLAEDEVRRLNDRLEEKVAERTAELLAANEQLQGFTYSVAHDLRQQIRGISTNASIVLEDAPEALDESSRYSLDRLVRSAKQLSTLVDDLLRYARIGRQQPSWEEVSLSELAGRISAQLAADEYRDGRTTVEVEPGMIVCGDHAMLGLALQNLIDNAFKYSSRVAEPKVRVGRDADGFFVEDNGIGFDQAFAHKVFEPFERLHGTAFKGTGIGLANVRRIVEKHGGRLWVESQPNCGAKFYFTLGERRVESA